MKNEIGTQKGTSGTSMNLNTQKGCGAQKPSESAGTHNPGNTRPPSDGDRDVPMAIPMGKRGE